MIDFKNLSTKIKKRLILLRLKWIQFQLDVIKAFRDAFNVKHGVVFDNGVKTISVPTNWDVDTDYITPKYIVNLHNSEVYGVLDVQDTFVILAPIKLDFTIVNSLSFKIERTSFDADYIDFEVNV